MVIISRTENPPLYQQMDLRCLYHLIVSFACMGFLQVSKDSQITVYIALSDQRHGIPLPFSQKLWSFLFVS